MQVVSSAALPHTSVLWASRPQGWMLTVLCKATFVLAPGASPLAEAQEDIALGDEHWNDDPRRSLRVASDVVPFKPRADVLLVGTAYAPSMAPARSIVTRLVVGEVDKSVEVSQDRWFQADGSVVEGQRFSRMPLVYERAGGGPDTPNPVGIRAGAQDGMGRVRIPNLSLPGVVLRSTGEIVEPVGYGPIAPSWPARREKLGRTVLPQVWYDAPLPDGLDFRYFNAAPPDQQTDFLPPGPRLVLENLHPSGGRFTTVLASVLPYIQIEGRGGAPQPMRADTLWIDTDRLLCTVTFRAQIPVRQPDEPGEVKLWVEGTPAAPEASQRSARKPEEDTATFSVPSQAQPVSESPPQPASGARALPFRAHTQEISTSVKESGGRTGSTSALPFLNLSSSSISVPAPPGAAPAPPTFFSASAAPPAPPAPAAVPPPPPVFAPPGAVVPPPPGAVVPPLPGAVVPPLPGAVVPPPPSASAAWVRPAPLPVSAPAEIVIPLGHDGGAALSGVVSASDAAATPRADTPPAASPASAPVRRRPPPSEVVDLLWFDQGAPQRVRQQTAWAPHLRDPQKPVEWIVGEEPEEPTQAAADRRDVRRALGRVPLVDAAGITRLMDDAVDEDGIFDRPLLVVGGELAMSYDPLETLKTSLAVASQLAGADKRLKEVLDAASETANGPRSAVGPLVEGALSRLRQAFTQANRSLSPDYLETTVQRILIEERCYLRRKLLGGTHIGGLLALAGGGAPVPTYLPEELAEKLPLYAKFRVRAIAEPHAQQDPAESEPIALRVLALGRSMAAPGGRGRS
jgi:hypothetical protein